MIKTLQMLRKTKELKQEHAKKSVSKNHLSNHQWIRKFSASSGKGNQMGRFVENALAKSSQSINKRNFSSQRKSTFKEEFVTLAESI
jgi:hypothetical protein